MVFAMLGPASTWLGGDGLWRRYLALALDGLRATDRPALPVPAPALGSLDDVIAASKGR